MILTTLVASTTYAWIEGFAIETPRYEATQVWWILGHFSTYSLAMGIMFACITGGFGLLKARSMFVRGKRYFLFTFAGNFPFSWLVEDFAFFWFSPEWRLTSDRWTNWILGGVWLLDPWRTGVQIWIPTWYLPVTLFWLGMMWYAHRCTIYDNVMKDEIAREIIPRKITIPEPKKAEPQKPTEVPPLVVEELPPEVTPGPSARVDSIEGKDHTGSGRQAPEAPTVEKKTPRSHEAEEAIRKLRQKWMRDDRSEASVRSS